MFRALVPGRIFDPTNLCPWIDGWPSRPRVMRLVDFLQALLYRMRVNLRCRNISVPQHELDGAQIRSPLQEMRGKAVTEFMRSQPSAQTQLDAVIMQHLPDGDAAEPPTASRQEQDLMVQRRSPRPEEFGPRAGKVGLHRGDGLASDGNQAFLVAFADAPNAAHSHIHVRNAQIEQFGNPKAGGIQDFEHRSVSQTHRSRRIRSLHEAVHLFLAQVRGEPLAYLRRLEVFRRVHADQFLHQGVLEKTTERNQVSSDGPAVQFLLIEIGKEVDDIFTVHRVDLVFVTLGQKAGEPSQIPAISENGVLGQTPLHSQIAQENVNGRIYHS